MKLSDRRDTSHCPIYGHTRSSQRSLTSRARRDRHGLRSLPAARSQPYKAHTHALLHLGSWKTPICRVEGGSVAQARGVARPRCCVRHGVPKMQGNARTEHRFWKRLRRSYISVWCVSRNNSSFATPTWLVVASRYDRLLATLQLGHRGDDTMHLVSAMAANLPAKKARVDVLSLTRPTRMRGCPRDAEKFSRNQYSTRTRARKSDEPKVWCGVR